MPPGPVDGVKNPAQKGDKKQDDASKADQPIEDQTKDKAGQGKEEKPNVNGPQTDGEPLPKGPWGDRGVTHRNAGMYQVSENAPTLNVRINLDLRADVALELHAVVQGSVIIGLF
ncbi:hypothetical protein ASPVEDRAFT_362318 [Aspergillus versicolor CBS 583.65]|uniref:Uncharacterized protein n=1 Tax=Aspergillus versicolor CBS 583.65 TaxID=1036611 RepID=A0A1L9Q0F4_ASPVE|nr:uncharacterized protein ASPVEDRAFT_362318 [Aspergillus versicolor CBS 583.65]OJJ07239.1 hypothetical protein ASPVEDRAFT_362318 [Aspergillus versicolor CBS 583.65]